tara:strand:- start:21 stop:602 length:582 start_codon:yes stop_codon:yes gene_type:complete
MKRLLLILILTFSFQSLTKADDIRDLEIEGIAISDSLLNFYTQDEININYYPSSNKFYYSVFKINDSTKYSEIQVVMKDKDKKYIVYGLRAGKMFPNKINECLNKKDILIDEFTKIIGKNFKSDSYPKYIHSNSYPNSFVHSTQFEFKNNDLIRIYCMDWSTKASEDNGWKDNLSLEIQTSEYRKFLDTEAYK